MVQEALQNRVAPAMGAAFGALAAEIGSTNLRVDSLEAEVRALKLRTAWTERDRSNRPSAPSYAATFRTGHPHRTGRPPSSMPSQRPDCASREGHMIGDDGRESLSAVSILTVPNLTFRQKALQACNRIRPRYVENPQPDPSSDKKCGHGDTGYRTASSTGLLLTGEPLTAGSHSEGVEQRRIHQAGSWSSTVRALTWSATVWPDESIPALVPQV